MGVLLSSGNIWVMTPAPFVVPSRNNIRVPTCTYSGRNRNRNSTDAVSFILSPSLPIIPSKMAVCLILPMCTVVWNPCAIDVE